MSAIETPSSRAMDRIYKHQRRFYDLTRKYYLLGRDELLDALKPAPGQSVLEIGCGTGRNLVAAAKRYPEAQMHGFDVSSEMLDTAGRAVARAGLASHIRLGQADATLFNSAKLFGRDGLDRVFISYTLSMIPDWPAVLERAVEALSPGGELHIVDFGQQAGLPGAFRRMLYAWLARFSVYPDAQLVPKLTELAERHGLSLEISHPWRGYAVSAVLRRA
ncbi:MAG: class I SAM-dependent methyltransferase [Bosea sp. (in: a-proteobacteria)]